MTMSNSWQGDRKDCLCIYSGVSLIVRGGQRTTSRIWLALSTTWIPGPELRLSVPSSLSHLPSLKRLSAKASAGIIANCPLPRQRP